MSLRSSTASFATIASTLAIAGCAPSALPTCEQGGETPCTFEAWDHACEETETPPCETTAPVTEDRTLDTLPAELDDVSRVFVVSAFTIPDSAAFGDARLGFDVDGLDAGADGSSERDARCDELVPDHRSVYDAAAVGVDSAIAGLVTTAEALLDPADCPGGTSDGCVDGRLAEAVATGDFLLAVEVGGLESLTHDPAVTVAIHLVHVEDGAPTFGGGDRLVVDRTLGRDPLASVFAGRVRARFDTLEIPFPRYPGTIYPPSEHRAVEIRFDIADRGLSRGVIGGAITVDGLVDRIVAILPDDSEGTRRDTRRVIQPLADLSPRATEPQTCDELSVGYGFAAAAASFAP